MVPGVGCTPRKQKLQRSSLHTGHDSLNPRAAARENCGTHACERRELLESRRSGPPASAPGRQTCSRSYDVGLLTTGLLAGVHPTRYVAAIMSDTPLGRLTARHLTRQPCRCGAVLGAAITSRGKVVTDRRRPSVLGMEYRRLNLGNINVWDGRFCHSGHDAVLTFDKRR